MKHRILRAAAAIAAVGLVAACAAPGSTPAASNSKAPAAATASAPVATPAPAASEAQHIVVQPGQSVSRIAAKYGLPKRAVIAANHLTPPYKVKIGQRLLIPGGAAAPAGAPPTAPLAPVAGDARHIVVQPGQSVSRLAVRYHVPRHAIIAANQLTPPYKVKIGQRLVIPGAAAAPPPETIAAEAPAPAGSSALPPAAISPVTAPPPASATSADNKSPVAAEPLHAPVAPAPIPAPTMTTGKPSEPSGPAAVPPEPAATASAPPPVPAAAVVPAAAPPGVSCPPGTVGVTERDVIKMPVFVCHRIHPQE